MEIISRAIITCPKRTVRVFSSGKILFTRENSKRMRWKVTLAFASQRKNTIKVASKMVGEMVAVYITTLMTTSSKEIGKTI
jgi:hypothetical protein